ncbi:MAG: ATP-grasp domain-containing protein [Melioribacteraceae bacterium]|nr:ATP-grasp domain-containing protein [Melioribacteraceae bacterium]
MNKSILIFGAGLNQLTLIKSAKELGLIAIVIDPSDNAPSKGLADFFYRVDGQDYETTKLIAIKHNVLGIVTSQMEKPMRLMAKLAQDLGLIFHTPVVTEKSLDKWLMKKTFLENNVPCAKGKLLKDSEEFVKEFLSEISFPLIIKPKDATSSQGVYKIENFEEIEKYRNITSGFSKTSEIIIEEFLDGPEFSVESITFNGKTTIVQITEKFVTPFPRTVEMGHLQPAQLNKDQKKQISEVVISAINAICIDNSAAHTEVKLTSGGPKIVEIGARLGGDYISSYLTLHSCGVNMDRAAIQIAFGEEPNLNPTLNQFSYVKYFDLPAGKKVEKIEQWDDVLENEDIVFANLAVKEGDIIEEITESKKRPGFVIVKGYSRTDVIEKALFYENKLKQKITLGDQ